MERPDDIWVQVPFEVDKKFDGLRVDQFLTQRLKGYSRNKIQSILEDLRVMRQGKPLRASHKVHTMDHIQLAYPRQPEASLDATPPLPVLFEDDAFVVINKPSGLLSHPTDKVVVHTVLGYLAHHRRDVQKLHLLHRLDRDTSGVLALAKTPEIARRWTTDMEARRIQKTYLALVRGTPKPLVGTIRCPIGLEEGLTRARQWVHVPGAASAVTDYEVIAPGDSSVVRVTPKTGRLHQIRVHLSSIGHPILGDTLYTGKGEWFLKMVAGTLTAEDRQSLGFPRVALHAERLQFVHPTSGQQISIQAPWPEDLAKVLIARDLK